MDPYVGSRRRGVDTTAVKSSKITKPTGRDTVNTTAPSSSHSTYSAPACCSVGGGGLLGSSCLFSCRMGLSATLHDNVRLDFLRRCHSCSAILFVVSVLSLAFSRTDYQVLAARFDCLRTTHPNSELAVEMYPRNHVAEVSAELVFLSR